MRRSFTILISACAGLAGVGAPKASAAYPASFKAVSSNPVQALNGLPIERFSSDAATHCQKGSRPGTKALAKWLGKHAKGDNWGIYRCEKWGKGSASLHAEGRALDWGLNVGKPKEKKEAIRLISMMLAPDALGRPAALARRMGVQEIIWDCKYWGGQASLYGTPTLVKYSACKKGVDKTTAHRNHVHFGMNKRGSAKQTSWWTRVAPPPAEQDGAPSIFTPAAAPSGGFGA